MKTGIKVITATLLLSPILGCGTDEKPTEYGLVWQDEFEGPAGELPDPGKWVFDTGTDWGNLQLEYDTDRPENVSLDGKGHLAITARREEYRGQPYTSGRIKTKGLFERTRGRFEARIKLPVGQGIWPAFWMLGNDIDQVGWPECGELDIMEYRGHEPRVLFGSIHGPGYAGDDAISGKFLLPRGGLNQEFHTYAVDWDGEGLTWFIDGERYHHVAKSDIPAGSRWAYDHPFFILLNVAVGGRWAGSPDENTVFPQIMLVDWVRVHGTLP